MFIISCLIMFDNFMFEYILFILANLYFFQNQFFTLVNTIFVNHIYFKLTATKPKKKFKNLIHKIIANIFLYYILLIII